MALWFSGFFFACALDSVEHGYYWSAAFFAALGTWDLVDARNNRKAARASNSPSASPTYGMLLALLILPVLTLAGCVRSPRPPGPCKDYLLKGSLECERAEQALVLEQPSPFAPPMPVCRCPAKEVKP